MKLFSLLLIVFFKINLFAQLPPISEKMLIIADAKTSCFYNNSITSCLKVKVHKDSLWKEFPYEIEGFIWEPGFETQIEFTEERILNPEPNGPEYKYKLLRIVEAHNTILDNKRILSANKWKLINIESNRVMIPSKRANAYLFFDVDSNRISGFLGCNNFSANTLIENGILSFGILTSTMMSCANDETEKTLKTSLTGKAAFYVRNNILFVVCQDNSILHFRPDKKLDSIIAVLRIPPTKYDGNTYVKLPDGNFSVKLDYLKEGQNRSMMFKPGILTAEEKKTIKYKLVHMINDDQIAELHILTKAHKYKDMFYGIVVMKDGTRQSVLIQYVD